MNRCITVVVGCMYVVCFAFIWWRPGDSVVRPLRAGETVAFSFEYEEEEWSGVSGVSEDGHCIGPGA
jgi:hypothetical protein